VKVSADLFALAYEAVSTEETRYYLNGVFVQPHHDKGAFLVSTDGHRMVVIHDDKAEVSESAIVQLPKYARQQLKSRRGFKLERKALTVDIESKNATISTEIVDKDGLVTRSDQIMTAHNVIIEGTFPDWRRVCPKGKMEAAGVIGLNSRYVSSLGKFGAQFDSINRGGMYFMKPEGQSDDGPIMIRWGNVHHIFAVLMPYRTDVEMNAPSFLTPEE
jgi:hypothetical protein